MSVVKHLDQEAEHRELKSRLMSMGVPVFTLRQAIKPKFSCSLDTICEEEDQSALSDSDEDHTRFSGQRVEILFIRRQKIELRIANDGNPYPYHEFMMYYGVPGGHRYWNNARVLQ